MRLGKKSPTYDRRDLLMSNYLDENKLPPIPESFGHEGIIGDWRMLANDKIGCCVLSGAAHETMLLSAMGDSGGNVFNDAVVIADYSSITGYDPLNPFTDKGTYVRDAMSYRQKTGVMDAFGNRHKIQAYASIEPGNWIGVLTALYIFGTVGVGIEFPESAMDQFEDGVTWSVVPGATIGGGHYIPLVAYRGNLFCITWGKEQQMTRTFFEKYCDEVWAFVTEEYMQRGVTPEGFAIDDLMSDLRAVQA